MKLNCHHKLVLICLVLSGTVTGTLQAQDSTAPAPVLAVKYFLNETKTPYVEVSVKKKNGRVFEPVKNIPVSVYLGEAAPENLLGKITTGKEGLGRVAFPAAQKATWDSLTEFKIMASSDSVAGVEAMDADVTIKKAILVIDTAFADGIRTVTAQLKEKSGNEWVAVKEIEMKLGIKRSLGLLSVGDAETYTADSAGIASAEFKRDSMPGDDKGNLVLLAKVEDNDVYGNLVAEKAVPWGRPASVTANFWHRTLWSTGDRAPLWLLFIALSIIIGVWAVIFFMVRQLFRLRKMGREFKEV